MTTEEVLLTVLTVAIVVLIITVITVLIMVLKIARKVNHVTEQVQAVTDKGTRVAEALAPMGIVTMGFLQIMKTLVSRRR